MAELSIIEVPDTRLLLPSMPVERIDSEVEDLATDMFETMASMGVGISAVQVGILRQVVIIDLQMWGSSKRYTMLNPEITGKSEEMVDRLEACLSIPYTLVQGGKLPVLRHKLVSVRYRTLFDQVVEEDLDEKSSWILQHEYDHLRGKLITHQDYPQEAQPQTLPIAC